MLVIGGGIIGLEMAQVYHALGSEITIVEMLDQLIPPADKDIVQPLFLKLKKRYRILTRTSVTEVQTAPDGIMVHFSADKQTPPHRFDSVLVAVGRKPNTVGLGLENLDITPDEKGFIEVNNRLQTAADHIFAVGDITGEPMLAHKATHQGKQQLKFVQG